MNNLWKCLKKILNITCKNLARVQLRLLTMLCVRINQVLDNPLWGLGISKQTDCFCKWNLLAQEENNRNPLKKKKKVLWSFYSPKCSLVLFGSICSIGTWLTDPETHHKFTQSKFEIFLAFNQVNLWRWRDQQFKDQKIKRSIDQNRWRRSVGIRKGIFPDLAKLWRKVVNSNLKSCYWQRKSQAK